MMKVKIISLCLLGALLSIQAMCSFHYTDMSYYRNLTVDNQVITDTCIQTPELSICIERIRASPNSLWASVKFLNNTNVVKSVSVSKLITISLLNRKYTIKGIDNPKIVYGKNGKYETTNQRVLDSFYLYPKEASKRIIFYELIAPFTYTEFKSAYLNDSLHLDFCCDENNQVIKARMVGDKFRYVKKVWDK